MRDPLVGSPRPSILVRVACLAVLGFALGTPPSADAGCNLIPQAQPAFRGALGTLDRPYAAPGDFIDVNVRQTLCDGASDGIDFDPAQHEVTLVFEPNDGPRRAVVLTTQPCAGLTARLDACESAPGIANDGVSCIQVNQPGDPIGLGIAFVDGVNRLRVRFPDTDALLAPDGDRRGFTGPATIAVGPAGGPLPCGLAAGTCATQAKALGLLACVDELYAADGTCQPNVAETFTHFTALPPPNDFQADCYSTSPPCTTSATELRFALDRENNLLFPVHWQGVLPPQTPRPVPRLLRVTVRPPVPITIPEKTFLSSFTPEGQPLPPIFEPQADPTLSVSGALNLFGTSDAPSTVLRVAQRRGVCNGGANAGAACNVHAQCGAGTCVSACVGGVNDGLACASKKDCTAGTCGALFDAEPFLALAGNGGPMVVPRVAAPLPGVCQAPPFNGCTSNADCGVDPCVSYAFQAQDPVSLESVSNGSAAVLTITAPEALAISDRNGDGDIFDLALTVRNRATGETQPFGAPAGVAGSDGSPSCGLTGTPESRAVVHTPLGSFPVPAVATEGNVVAFIESENDGGYCDENDDTDRFDGILRVFTVPGNERTASLTPPRAVDPALRLNDQSVAVSNGTAFFRSSEAAMARKTLERVSVATGLPGAEANDDTLDAQLAKGGRWVVFSSFADNLLGPGADTNTSLDVFTRDRVTGAVARMSTTAAGAEVVPSDSGSGGVGAWSSISADGRYVVFQGITNLLDPGDTNLCFGGGPCSDIYLRDRDTDTDDVFDEPGAVSLTRVSVGPLGVQGDNHSERPIISPNGEVVVFQSYATNLVAGDTNGDLDIFAWDRDTGVVERLSVGSNEAENLGVQSEPRVYDVSDDGRYVVFDLRTTNLPDGNPASHAGPSIDVFLRDRVAGETIQITKDYPSAEPILSQFAYVPAMSGDARYFVFQNDEDFSGQVDIQFFDRETSERAVMSDPMGNAGHPPYFALYPEVSDDGRFVVFWSEGSNLLGSDVDGNSGYDLFVRDRRLDSLERLTVRADGQEGSGDFLQFGPAPSIAPDGSEVLFVSSAINLLGSAVDSNSSPDAFIRGIDAADPNGVDALLYDDDALDDTVLEAFDAAGAAITTLCPANDVAVANGAAAFLRPEAAVGTIACPAGPLNSDGDTSDEIVQLWPGSGGVQNLGKAATAVALTATHVAAIVSEAGENGPSLNGDGDPDDGVLAVKAVSGGAWANVEQQAELVLACGSAFAFLTSEAAQGAGSLNPDADADSDDRVAQIYVPETDTLINLGMAAVEIVCNDQIVAFRTNEADQGDQNLQAGSGTIGFMHTDVMHGYDVGRPECLTPGHPVDCLRNSQRAADTCYFEACDPRVPYKLVGTGVKFIVSECTQRGTVADGACEISGTDFTGDLDANDTVLQIFDVRGDSVRVIGGVEGSGDPLQTGTPDDESGTTILVATGRCIETLAGPCVANTDCGSGELCDANVCKREHRTCVSHDDCPPGVACVETFQDAGVVAASPDTDDDSVPDHIDNCVDAANGEQTDGDGDGVGDACDLSTCGDGQRTYDEVCEAGDDALCPGACSDCRCTVCETLVNDPKAKVQLKTKNEAGQLNASVTLALGTYADEPVTVSLADLDTPEIVREPVGTLPPSGKAPFKKWVRKTKLKTGITQAQIQKRPPKEPGMFKVTVKAKQWFTAAAANQLPAATELTITVGTQCFRVPVTKKTD